jgi:hypothetical protein
MYLRPALPILPLKRCVFYLLREWQKPLGELFNDNLRKYGFILEFKEG